MYAENAPPFYNVPPFYDEFDLLVQRPTGEIVMLVNFRFSDWVGRDANIEKLTPIQAKQLVPYAMLVEYQDILVFDLKREKWQEPILTLSTLEMLPEQAINIKQKNIFGSSLIKFIRFWLDYLAHPNYGKNVPGVKELDSVGILPHILGATIRDLDAESSSPYKNIMYAENAPPFYDEFDLLVQRPTGKIVMLVNFRFSDWVGRDANIEKLTPIQAKQLVPYSMLVEYQDILLFDLKRENWQEPILTLSTLEMLPEQAVNIKQKNIFGSSLVKFIRFWLDYLAHPNYGKNVPGVKELDSVGILPHILGATIRDLDAEN